MKLPFVLFYTCLLNSYPAVCSSCLDYTPILVKEVSQEPPPALDDVPDLQTWVQDFILETKQIEIPGYPDAFNPSIIRWNGSLLMSFRAYNPQTGATNPFALVWLDENFEPISTPQVFELPSYNPILPSKQQDPRLIAVGNRLLAVYNNISADVTQMEMRRMFVVEFFYDGAQFTAGEPECLAEYEWKKEWRYEKNWVPFEYEGELLLSYDINPHRVVRPIFGTNACETVASTETEFQWDFGYLKGGTQALRDGDLYLSFFHSWINMPSVQSNGKNICHYLMGAYTFQAEPPFALTAVSPMPIVAKDFYEPPYHKTWKPMRCVFPAGILIDNDFIWISYGRQDHEIWIAKLDKKALIESLTPLPSR